MSISYGVPSSDRDYMRAPQGDAGAGWSGEGESRRVLPVIVVATAMTSLVAGAFAQRGETALFQALALWPREAIGDLQAWRLLSYALLHAPGNLFHLAWNLLFLWFLGESLERVCGGRRFFWLYAGGAVAGGLLHCVFEYGSGRPVVGASAAVLAVAVVAAFHFPRRLVGIWFLFPVPLWLLVALYVGLDGWHLLAGTGSGTAFAAHVGGAAFGVGFHVVTSRGLRLPSRVRGGGRGPEVRPRPDGVPRPEGETLDEAADRILAKVSRSGMDSLSDEERVVLERASEEMRRRRGR